MIPICQVPPERDSTPLGQRVPENVAAETIEKRDADSERCETRQSLDDEQSRKRFPPLKKKVITSVVTMSGFNAAMDSMIISSAIPEVASTFNTTGSIINISNGLYVLFMALCPLFWGPLSQVFGRRWVSQVFNRHHNHRLGFRAKAGKVWSRLNPVNVFVLMRYPNLLAAYMAAAALIWNQQTLLTPVRYVINPRFNLTTPMQSGYFFLAPGVGCLLGAVIGGPWADRTVRKWHARRGERVPEDRLRSSLLGLGVVIPVAVLVYGWTIEKEAGGIPVPVIAMFLQGLGQMLCFPSINAYCLDVKKDRGAEVISGAYM
ncbi:hypothetical protein E8E14_005797 [Neopestalotiopsis sp. 37M]|nr:hypothetical protein E8E14_005797 [Neopestalotiopsis sp. 37M]